MVREINRLINYLDDDNDSWCQDPMLVDVAHQYLRGHRAELEQWMDEEVKRNG